MASCPPSKNDPTAVEKTLPPLFKSVEHYLWEGMKPFPALTPLLEGMMHVNFISFQRTYPYMDCTYSFAFSAPLREPHFSRDIFLAKPQRALRHAYPQRSLGVLRAFARDLFPADFFSRQAAKGAKACIPLRSLGVLRDFARASFLAGCFFSPSR